jgi:hypothetical protein
VSEVWPCCDECGPDCPWPGHPEPCEACQEPGAATIEPEPRVIVGDFAQFVTDAEEPA